MKKIIALLFFTALVSAVSAETIQIEILGSWSAEPFVIEQENGLLLSPEAAYSHPYLGITGINFIDGSFVIFTIMDVEYRAFYEIESLDFDTYNINCSFRVGEEFLLKLVRISEGRWKYLYRIASNSVLKGVAEIDEDLLPQESEEDSVESEMIEIDAEKEKDGLDDIYSIYTGIMKSQ